MPRSGFSCFFNKKPLGSLCFFLSYSAHAIYFMLGSSFFPFFVIQKVLSGHSVFFFSCFWFLCSSGQRDKFPFLINSFVPLFSHKSYFHAFCKQNTRTECLFILHWVFFSLKLFCDARTCLVLFSFSQISITGPYINLFLIPVAYLLLIISKISNSAKSFVCWQIICCLPCLHDFLSVKRIFTKRNKKWVPLYDNTVTLIFIE